MFRKRKFGSKKYNERLERARQAQLQNRLDLTEQTYPPELPCLRRKIVVTDYDFGEPITHEILLYRSNRIDVYEIVVDGRKFGKNLGWARVLELVRKAFIRIQAF